MPWIARSTAGSVLLAVALALPAAGCDMSLQDPEPSGPDPGAAGEQAPAGSHRLGASEDVVVESGGTRIPIEEEAVVGYVDNAIVGDDAIDVSGWAAKADLSGPADTVAAFAGRASVAALQPAGERPDLVDGYDKPQLLRSGFVLTIPMSDIDCSAPLRDLKAVGIVDGAAGELEWLGDAKQQIAAACR